MSGKDLNSIRVQFEKYHISWEVFTSESVWYQSLAVKVKGDQDEEWQKCGERMFTIMNFRGKRMTCLVIDQSTPILSEYFELNV